MSGPGPVFRAMLAKDLRREFRSREIFISGFLFSVILLTIIYFSTTASGLNYTRFASGALWLCIVFSGTIGLNRIHYAEMANGCYRALILYPVDGGWIYLAKVCANSMLLGAMTVLLVPLLAVFFGLDLGQSVLPLVASLMLGVTAFTAVGTLVVAITANTRMREVLFPVVQLPLVVPVVIGGVNSTEMALRAQEAGGWLSFLVALDVAFLSLGFLLYEFLLEE